MRCQRATAAALTLFLLLVAKGVGQEGSAITWESYKEVEFEFGDSLLRVGSDYQAYTYATGGSTGWLSAHPSPEITEITSSITTDFSSTQTSSPRATASAVAGWLLNKDDSSGIATLSNAAAGTTAVVDKYDPTVAAMSWAAQSTSLEVGEEVAQGIIDWSPGILVSASGGSFLSTHDSVSIHDPIVVWTRRTDTDVIEPTTLFELTAEFDSKTELHWNEVREIRTGIDGEPEFVIIPNDGPFLNAGVDGSGSFRLRLASDLLPVGQRGTLALEFQDGIVTASTATGVFSDLAPRPDGAVLGKLPEVGEPAIIESILIDNNDDNGRFALNVDVGQDRVITDVAACSDGVHISVGPAVDTIQTFTLNPLQRSPVTQVNADAETAGLPGLCLGTVRQDAELLFGSSFSPAAGASLHPEAGASPIDRFLRLDVDPTSRRQTIVFEEGENSSPTETRRWTASFDVRLSNRRGPLPVEPIDVSPFEDATGGADGGLRPADSGATSAVGTIGAVDIVGSTDGVGGVDGEVESIGATFAIGLVDAATYGDTPAPHGDVALDEQEVSLFGKTDGIVLKVIDRHDSTIARLTVDGEVVAEGKIPPQDRRLSPATDSWQHFELGLRQQHAGVDVLLHLVSHDGADVLSVIEETIPKLELSPHGYRLAVGSLVHQGDVTHDVDNLMTTFQQAGDVAWDGTINVDDFRLMSHALESGLADFMFDIDLNGAIDFGDLERIEDLIPNKTPGDANFDGRVDFPDFLTLSAFFGESTGLWSRGDFDSNGLVEFADFLLLAQNYDSADDGSPRPVPEPMGGTMLLLAVYALGRLRPRRK